MKHNDICPGCSRYRFNRWKKSVAYWPFKLQCGNCGRWVRVSVPRWQNITVQILGQIAFWTGLLLGIRAGWPDAIYGAAGGALILVLLAMIPGYFGRLTLLNHR